MSFLKSELKLFLIVAVVSAALAIAGILLLKAGLRPGWAKTWAKTVFARAAAYTPQTPQKSEASAGFAGWQTYRNDELGFEVRQF